MLASNSRYLLPQQARFAAVVTGDAAFEIEDHCDATQGSSVKTLELA
jgi:hypothetical protein